MQDDLLQKLRNIKLLAMDFDGVHTDAHVLVNQDGVEMVRCSRRDGMGLEMVRRKTDVKLCVISKEVNPVVKARCDKLQIPCFHGVDTGGGKLEILQKVMREYGVSPDEVIYMGDDVVDIAPMKHVFGVAVADAHPAVKEVAKYTTSARGGRGAVREVCDMILAAKGMEMEF